MLKNMISDISTIYSQALTLFPYWTDALLERWQHAYIDLILRVANDPSSVPSIEVFYHDLMAFVSLLNDGHSRIYLPQKIKKRINYLPFKLEVIEEQLVIVASLPEYHSYHFQPIKKINGRTAADFLHSLCTHYWQSNTMYSLICFQNEPSFFLPDDSLLVEFENKELATFKWNNNQIQWDTPFNIPSTIVDKVIFSNKNLLIIHLPNTTIVKIKDFMSEQVVEDFYQHLPYLQASQEIIFDIRGNAGGNSGHANEIAQAFFSDKIQIEKVYYQQFDAETYAIITQTLFHVPKDQLQNHEQWNYLNHQFLIEKNEYDFYPKRKGLLKDKVVKILIDHLTYSSAENFAIIFDQSGRGLILGETSAGSTGQPALIKLKTGGTFMVTAKKVLHPNGHSHHNIGIMPKVTLKKKLSYKHTDQVLKKALELSIEKT
ncbi:S41 family peptidase [Enterococcus sp.]|uniref:S41 family peptidase n=1 Tax=Enterococcus sp. TaxID=35783 RepID=UPI0028A29041|nr:S41 family peptidase [Enterococcus sp.]